MPETTPLRQFLFNRTVAKIVGTVVLTLLLLIPVASIEELIDERNSRKDQVLEELGQQWGPDITIRGPLLVMPTSEPGHHQYLVPDKVVVDGDVPVVERYRSVFRLPTYRATLNISGEFSIPAAAASGVSVDDPASPVLMTIEKSSRPPWQHAEWVLLVGSGDNPPVQVRLTPVGEKERSLRRADDVLGITSSLLRTPVALGRYQGKKFSFKARVDMTGSSSVGIAPLAEQSSVALRSDWPHPSFAGDRLPTARTISAEGFRATWDLNGSLLGIPSTYTGERILDRMLHSPLLTVRFVEAVSHYQQVTRSAKYALMVIALTFVAFFLFEILCGLNIHPIQYLLVGAALTMFYLLLLSLSEHLSFAWSYAIAGSAVVLLIATYARALLAKSGRAAGFGLGLGAVYGLLYVILREETLALLAGSWSLFAVLALIMFLTRKIDWSSLNRAELRRNEETLPASFAGEETDRL